MKYKDNIDSGNPIIANLACSNPNYIWHAVTIYGYTSSEIIKYWDSYLNREQGGRETQVYANVENKFLEMDKHSYYWASTLSKM